MITKQPLFTFLPLVLACMIAGCNDQLLPPDTLDDIWTGRSVIHNAFNVLRDSYGPIYRRMLNGDSVQLATGFLLYPPRHGRFIYSTEDGFGTKSINMGDTLGNSYVVMDGTSGITAYELAALSDDAQLVAFVGQKPPSDTLNSLYVLVNGAASPQLQIPLPDVVSGIMFSPGSPRYVAVSVENAITLSQDIYICDLASKMITGIIDTRIPDVALGIEPIYWFQWMPDGEHIAYRGYDTFNQPGIFIASIDGSSREQIAYGNYLFPAPSPDGARMAFIRDNQLGLINIDGSNEQQITQGPLGANEIMLGPQWSADGSKILLIRARVDLSNPGALLEAVDLATQRRKAITAETSTGFWLD